MSTSMSQYGSIRYPYYRCRSTAGGRPPCPSVNVQCYEIESFICRVLGQPDSSDPPEMRGIAEAWNASDELTQRKLLPLILARVVWHQTDGEITIDLVDEAPVKIGEAREGENAEELG